MRVLVAGKGRSPLALAKSVGQALPGVSIEVNASPKTTWRHDDVWLADCLKTAEGIAEEARHPVAIVCLGKSLSRERSRSLILVPAWPSGGPSWRRLLRSAARRSARLTEQRLLGPGLAACLDQIVWADRAGTMVAANRSARVALGWNQGDNAVQPRRFPAEAWESLWREPARRIRLELSMKGERAPVEVGASFASVAGRRLICLFLRPVTASATESGKPELLQRNPPRQKDRFIANMSHEVRTPLAAIQGLAEAMALPGATLEERRDHIERIRRNVRSLTQILDDLLDLSKVGAGQITIERTAFSLPSLLSDVRQTYEPICARKGVRLVVTREEPIPDRVVCDANRLRQILFNVVGNATKFTDTGEIRLAVSARGAPDAIALHFRVADSGLGIPEEGRARLFEPFGRLHATSQGGGTGLGLALSRELARALGGDLRLAWTEPGKGTEFHVEVRAERDVARQPTLVYTSSRPERKRLEGLSVLVAEDDPDYQAFLKRMIEIEGGEAAVANDGLEAMVATSKRSFDVILMDVDMPRMGGLEAVGELRHGGDRTPVLALTAFAMKGDEERCLREGCDDYLPKPVEPERLIETVAHYGFWKEFAGPRSLDERPARERAAAPPAPKRESSTAYRPPRATSSQSGYS